jgi:hypothetical protein
VPLLLLGPPFFHFSNYTFLLTGLI